MLLAVSLGAQAKYREVLTVKYEQQYGWSKYYNVEVNFLTGYELNTVTQSFEYSSYCTYAVIFWSQGDCTVIKLNYVACGYEADSYCIDSHISMDGVDKRGVAWKLCLTDYCY